MSKINLIGFHVNAGGVPESPLYADRFPAGAVDNYLAEDWGDSIQYYHRILSGTKI